MSTTTSSSVWSVVKSVRARYCPTVRCLLQFLADHPRLLLGVGAAGGLITYHTTALLRDRKNLPPGPWPLPIIGSWHLINFGRVHESLLELGKPYGDVYTVYVFDQPFIILNSYSAIKEAFLSAGNQMAGRVLTPDFVDGIDEEVFMENYSEKWKEAKKQGIVAIRKFGGPQSDVDKSILDEISILVETLTGLEGEAINPMMEICKVTERGVAAFMFGMPDAKNDHPMLVKHKHAVIDMFNAFHSSYPWEIFYPVSLSKVIFKKHHAEFGKACLTLRHIILEKMEEIRPTMDPANPRCFLEYFMATRDISSMGGLTIFADTISLYTHEAVHSVAVLVEWAILYLASHPDTLAEIQKLTDKVVGSDGMVTKDHRGDLGLVESFLFEVQRHTSYTPISFAHSVTEDGVMFRGYHFPRDTPIIANLHAIYMDPELHPEPETFKPDRFLSEDGKFKKTNTVLTFSIGARACPGENYARMELFLLASNLAHRFNITFPADRPKPPLASQPNSFFKKPHDFQVVFTPR